VKEENVKEDKKEEEEPVPDDVDTMELVKNSCGSVLDFCK